jgi:hypothetical protein
VSEAEHREPQKQAVVPPVLQHEKLRHADAPAHAFQSQLYTHGLDSRFSSDRSQLTEPVGRRKVARETRNAAAAAGSGRGHHARVPGGGAGHRHRRGLQVLHVRLRPGPVSAPAGGADPPPTAGAAAAGPLAAPAPAAGAGGPRVLPAADRVLLLPAAAVRVPVADHVRATGGGDVPAGRQEEEGVQVRCGPAARRLRARQLGPRRRARVRRAGSAAVA